MTQDEIRSNLFATLSAWTTTRIAWPNRPFEPLPTEYWIRPTLRMGDAFNLEKGEDSGLDAEVGIFYIDLFCPIGKGSTTGLGYANTLRDLYRRKSYSDSDGDLLCNAVSVVDIGEELTASTGTKSGFYHIQLRVFITNFIDE